MPNPPYIRAAKPSGLARPTKNSGSSKENLTPDGSTVTSWMTPLPPSKKSSITVDWMNVPALCCGTMCSGSAIFARKTTAEDITRDIEQMTGLLDHGAQKIRIAGPRDVDSERIIG